MYWRRYMYSLWLSGSIPLVLGVGADDIRFWLIVLPTMLLVTIFNGPEDEQS